MSTRTAAGEACVPLLKLCLGAIFLIAQLIVTAQCQVSDGDEQFEFQHQDIGRISGLSSGSSQVAAQTTIVARQQQAAALSEQPASSPLPPAVAQVFDRAPQVTPAHHSGQAARAAHRSAQSGSQRKPTRITLVPRRDPAPSQASLQQAAPAPLIAAQLPAPPQQPQFQTAPSAVSASALEPLVQPTFAPLPQQIAPAEHRHQPHTQHHHHNQANQQAAGPALSSFRATGGSVSARHSALIAQVAAERAAAAASASSSLISPAQLEPATAQPSFGSPAEALSSPQAVAVAHQHHSQQHQHHQQQPSAFASFTGQQAASHSQPLTLAAAPSQQASFVNQPEEPVVAPSFEQVLGQGCPSKGVFSWENRDHCDRYYMCTNGTFTEEACPNGLSYSQQGAVYQHCAYNWNVNCGLKKTSQPIASPGCPWQFGIFPIVQAGRCSIDYFVCEWGVPDTKRCSPEGLFYDDRIKGCQWADQLGCKSESLLNFKCPAEDEDNQFWPFPRYYHSTKDVIVCVNEQPRLVHCTEDQVVDPGSLACMEINKKKQKF